MKSGSGLLRTAVIPLGDGGQFKVKIFCGGHQKKVDIEVAVGG